MTLSDRVVVITGGGGRLGREFGAAAAGAGASVVLADRDIDSALLALAPIVDAGGRAEAAELDITNREEIDALIRDLHERHGRIDAVVSSAYPRNANYGRRLEEVEFGDFCDSVSLHLGGYFLVAQRFALYFAERGGGNIINVASVYATLPPRFVLYEGTPMTMPVEYAAIKSAIVHLTKYFAQYYKKAGVRCNALSPGGILDRQPAGFVERYNELSGTTGMLLPQDVGGALVFLLSDAARHVTGQNLIVDDGFSL
jgi:NAD(P)-dependent dehydrogenase (short-subunit alcohol dehydrogenase family)